MEEIHSQHLEHYLVTVAQVLIIESKPKVREVEPWATQPG